MKNISIIFISILLEAIPYLLLGAILSALIEKYVSEETIAKRIPKNKILGALTGVILGFFIPACDCAIIPVSRKLIQKKVPLNVAVSFMLASPIINPVVLLSTYQAFKNTCPNMIWYRLILGILISLVIGILMSLRYKDDVLINKKDDHKHNHNEHDHCNCSNHEKGLKHTIPDIVEHTLTDFIEVLKYLIIGSFIASTLQVILPKTLLLTFQNNILLSIITLMIFAYLISLCSTSDSFIGSSLLQVFPQEAILAYLIVGPMIDIKNTIVLLNTYKKEYVKTLISYIFIITLIAVLVVMII